MCVNAYIMSYASLLCASIQMSVELVENVTQAFRVLLVGVEEHSLEVDRKAVPAAQGQ